MIIKSIRPNGFHVLGGSDSCGQGGLPRCFVPGRSVPQTSVEDTKSGAASQKVGKNFMLPIIFWQSSFPDRTFRPRSRRPFHVPLWRVCRARSRSIRLILNTTVALAFPVSPKHLKYQRSLVALERTLNFARERFRVVGLPPYGVVVRCQRFSRRPAARPFRCVVGNIRKTHGCARWRLCLRTAVR